MPAKRNKAAKTARYNRHSLRGQRPGRVGHDQPSARAERVPRADARRDDRRAEIDPRGSVHRVRGGDGRRRQVVLRGGDFYAMKRLNWVNAYMWNDRMQGLAMTIRGLPIPVIAMVNGWCMGGGHELALWCDLVIASENAVLGQTGATVGACPTVGATQYLPRIIGERLAREMIFCARASARRKRWKSGSSTSACRRRTCSTKRSSGAKP